MAKNLEITLVKSLIGVNFKQKRNAQSLGLSKVNQKVVKEDTPAIRGMINTISHLVKIEEK